MRTQLTKKQQRFLDYLQRKIAKSGLCPSLRRAATDLGVSHAAIAQMLHALEEKGYVRREGRYSRKVYLLNRAREAAALQRGRDEPGSSVLLLLLLLLFQFAFFLRSTLGPFLLFPFSLVSLSLITHIRFSCLKTACTRMSRKSRAPKTKPRAL